MRSYNKKRILTLSVCLLLVISFIFLIAYAVVVKRDFQLIAPGAISPVSETITIDGYTNNNSENFYTTAVYVMERPTILQSLFFKLINKNVQKYPMSEAYDHLTLDELSEGSKLSYISSKYLSIISAYEAAEYDIDYEVEGFYVTYYSDYDHYSGVISIGDVLEEVNGIKITRLATLRDILNSDSTCNTPMELSLRTEENDTYSINAPLTKADSGQCKVGLSLTEKIKILDTTSPYPTVDIPNNVGGSSGGLMNTLQVYSTLTGENLTKGYKIAGTGTMSLYGTVGPIGAADLKVITAENNDVDIFFVPADKDGTTNYSDAVKGSQMIDTDILIFPVNTLSEAISILKELQPK